MNYFIFDGESSLNYGVYIGGQNTFNAPQRDVAKVAIPGRNGDLVQDNGRFLNVQVPYNIVVMDSFRDKTDAIKAWLLSKKGYCKLVDTYHPGTYRMAMVAGGINFETAAYNLTGRTQVIFDCKPERFLDSGDEVFNVGEAGQSESASGSMVTFEGDEDEIFAKMQASITPTQNLNGYDYPWPAGGGPEGAPESNICPITGKTEAIVYKAGKNILNNNITSRVVNGITFTVNEDKTVTANGTATAEALFSIPVPDIDGDFLFSGCPAGGGSRRYDVFAYDTTARARYKRWNGTTSSASDFGPYIMQEVKLVKGHSGQIRFRVSEGCTVDNIIFKPMLVLKNTTDGSYAPYIGSTNRISWQTEAGEVYGGTVDVVSGLLTVDRAYISTTWGALLSETTVGTMIRRRCRLGDNVAISGKASISNIAVFDAKGFNTDYGARWLYDENNAYFYLPPDTSDSQEIAFVYFLATPQTYQLTGQQIEALLGTNNVWSNTGDMYVEWLLNPNIIHNPTRFDSRPKIRVKGSGSGTLTIENGTIVVSNLNEYVDIDSELMNCYKETANKNADVALPNHEYPELHPGANRVDFSGGVTGVEIKGRWWTI